MSEFGQRARGVFEGARRVIKDAPRYATSLALAFLPQSPINPRIIAVDRELEIHSDCYAGDRIISSIGPDDLRLKHTKPDGDFTVEAVLRGGRVTGVDTKNYIVLELKYDPVTEGIKYRTQVTYFQVSSENPEMLDALPDNEVPDSGNGIVVRVVRQAVGEQVCVSGAQQV